MVRSFRENTIHPLCLLWRRFLMEALPFELFRLHDQAASPARCGLETRDSFRLVHSTAADRWEGHDTRFRGNLTQQAARAVRWISKPTASAGNACRMAGGRKDPADHEVWLQFGRART